MPIPTFDKLLRPVLDLANREDITRRSATEAMARKFKLSPDEIEQRLPSGRSTYIRNRTGWAMSFLTKGGLISKIAAKTYRATDLGREFLVKHPDAITGSDLKSIPGWEEAWNTRAKNRQAAAAEEDGFEDEEMAIVETDGSARVDEQKRPMNIESIEQIQMEGEESDESPDLSSTTREREILTKAGDPEVFALHDKYKRGKLILQPDFQRQFVWDRKKSSRLIESILLSVPLPIIYLSEQLDGKEYVIDGQQRLTSLFSFIDGKFPAGEEFRLIGLNAYRELNKSTFKDIPEQLQDKILHYTLRSVTLLKQSNSDLKFEIFERLNTGSEPLNDQELRNCVYRGSYNRLLKELASDVDFRGLLGLAASDKRLKDVELVLRFSAFFHATYLKYQPPMKRFFNQDMEKYQHLSDSDAGAIRDSFKNSVQIVKSLFGNERAFKRFYNGDETNPSGRWEPKKFNASLYDVLMGVFHDKDKNQVYAALDSLREAIVDLMATSREFNESIELSTSSMENVKRRFDLMRQVVEGVINDHKIQPRCFSHALKQELFDNNPTCQICGQAIQQLDDAAVDHVEQYWRGGKTIPENARLAHRYCNSARPRTA